jgi:predicted outer membrane repeat protein
MQLAIVSCHFISNIAECHGGAVYWSKGVEGHFDDCTFSDNAVSGNCDIGGWNYKATGGAVSISSGCVADFSSCTFAQNHCTKGHGGAVYCGGSCPQCGDSPIYLAADVTFSDSLLQNNTADIGSGIYIESDSNVEIGSTDICGGVAEQTSGPWVDLGLNCIAAFCDDQNTNGIIDACECVADTNTDQSVDRFDLIGILESWGEFSDEFDVNSDSVVDILDLLLLLENWGPCP